MADLYLERCFGCDGLYFDSGLGQGFSAAAFKKVVQAMFLGDRD